MIFLSELMVSADHTELGKDKTGPALCSSMCFSGWEDTPVLQAGFDYCLFSLLPSQLQLTPPFRVAQGNVILSVVLYGNGGGRRQTQGRDAFPADIPVPPPLCALTFLPHHGTEDPSAS